MLTKTSAEADSDLPTGWLVAAYAAGLIVSSPPIAYIGATVRNRRIPLLIALLFMAGGSALSPVTSLKPTLTLYTICSHHPLHGDTLVHRAGHQPCLAVSGVGPRST